MNLKGNFIKETGKTERIEERFLHVLTLENVYSIISILFSFLFL